MYSQQENKMNVIRVNLGTTHYNKLILRILCDDSPNPFYSTSFNGFQSGNSWTFTYPDNLYDKNIQFVIQEDTAIDTPRYVGFKYICNNDTVGSAGLSFARKDTTIINAVYLQTDTFPNIPKQDKNGKTYFTKRLTDSYLLTSYQDKELLSILEASSSIFYCFKVDSSKYDSERNKFINLVKKYPDSHFLTRMLDYALYMFKTKGEVQKIYDCFSPDNKNSYFGKKIKLYLSDNYFKNSILKSGKTGKSEAIVTDSTKYNLIIFSASWCAPCIAEIPTLKKVYKDLSNKLDMTYVSIDETETEDEWERLMKKEDIPWRNVLAEEYINYIREKYHIPGVPYCLFVHPGGFMEPIDVRDTAKLNYLYKTVQEEK